MSGIQLRVARFLAQGLKPTQVASIVGITPARISQIVKEEGFNELLAAEAERYSISDDEVAARQLLANKYMAFEAKLLDTMDASVALMEPRDQIRALDVVIGRQAKMAAATAALRVPEHAANQTIVNIMIPNHAVPEYQVNGNGEIIAIDNKPMAPLPAEGVKAMFAQMRAQKAQALDQPATVDPNSLEDF